MRFSAVAKGDVLEMNFLGHVGDSWAPDGVSYKRVSRALRDNPQATKLKIRANSFGGDAFEGHAIRNLLQASGKHIEMEIDGVAASAMTVIAMGADHLAIAEDGQFMIHNSRANAKGTAADLRSNVQALENLDDAMVYVYSARTGKPQRQIREWMDAETWFSAKQAKEHGFVDEIVPAKGERPQADARFGFRALPEIYASRLQQVPSATTVAPDTDMDEQTLTRILAEALAPFAERLAQFEASAAQPKPRQPQPDPKPRPEPEPQPEPEPEPPIEVDPPVDAATAEVQALFEAAVIARFESFVAQGKLLPAAREHFVAACRTPAALRAVAALYENAPAVVATGAAHIPAIKGKPGKQYTAEARAWAERAKIDISQLDRVE
jgi:ATP-dependent Clp protease, protease subunit